MIKEGSILTENDIQHFIEDNKISLELHEKWKKEIFKRIVEYIEKNPKFIIDHRYDYPYDHSGELIPFSKYFLISLYKKVGDFLKEYDGNKEASYRSGCGWNYLTYSDTSDIEPISLGNKYAEYYLKLLIEKYNIDEGDPVDYYDLIYNYLGDDNFKLLGEIENKNLYDIYQKYSENKILLKSDYLSLRSDVLKIIETSPDNSTIMMFAYFGNDLIINEDFNINSLRNLNVEPDSELIKFHYLLNNAIHQDCFIIFTAKTKLKSGMFELKSMRIFKDIIDLISPEELKQCYSLCSDCETPIDPPKDYIFSQFIV
ncbi:MAG: hypothetical protein JXA99_08480 [Candidatus Lokiarchaeota archaeon]|nr:hypothetical protein [Candidatus Lokiarchaeota archaeon]